MNFNYAARQKKLNNVTGVDAIAIVPGANMVYYTGLHFHLSERPTILLYSRTGLTFIIPELEVPKLKERPDLEAQVFSWSDADGFASAFVAAVESLNLGSGVLGVDGQTMRVFERDAFVMAGAAQITNIGRMLLDIRSVKQPDEVEAIQRAIRASEDALRQLMAWVQPGMTERTIAAQLSRLVREAGCDDEAFTPLIQTGPNSALPHGFVTDRALEPNEFLLVDFGGKKHGYPADITRTFCLGTPSAEMRKIYETVLAANQAAIAKAGPGVSCGEVDKAARDVIEAAGYGEYFIHRTGHGLGLEGHELPQIAARVEAHLQLGMVFTIEPGIYVPGLGGVRIEDNVIVAEDGAEVLTTYPRSLSVE